jgi:hypothetical protein
MFLKGSRYAKVATLTMADPAGRQIVYKATRFIPNVTGASATPTRRHGRTTSSSRP